MKRRPKTRDDADKKDTTSVSHADADVFERAMADVVRLPPDPRVRVRSAPDITATRATPSKAPSAGKDDDDALEGGYVAPGVDRRELRKLKRGDYAPGNRLDLHGRTAAEAVASVKRFIDNSRARHRCICIIHGRGHHSEMNVSILRTRVREYLRQHKAVLAYTDAPRNDGGSGTVYVLLRK